MSPPLAEKQCVQQRAVRGRCGACESALRHNWSRPGTVADLIESSGHHVVARFARSGDHSPSLKHISHDQRSVLTLDLRAGLRPRCPLKHSYVRRSARRPAYRHTARLGSHAAAAAPKRRGLILTVRFELSSSQCSFDSTRCWRRFWTSPCCVHLPALLSTSPRCSISAKSNASTTPTRSTPEAANISLQHITSQTNSPTRPVAAATFSPRHRDC